MAGVFLPNERFFTAETSFLGVSMSHVKLDMTCSHVMVSSAGFFHKSWKRPDWWEKKNKYWNCSFRSSSVKGLGNLRERTLLKNTGRRFQDMWQMQGPKSVEHSCGLTITAGVISVCEEKGTFERKFQLTGRKTYIRRTTFLMKLSNVGSKFHKMFIYK